MRVEGRLRVEIAGLRWALAIAYQVIDSLATHKDSCPFYAEVPVDLYGHSSRKRPRPNMLMPDKWRVGSQAPINVYEGDRPVCKCPTEEDARRIVETMNAAATFRYTCGHYRTGSQEAGPCVTCMLRDALAALWNEVVRYDIGHEGSELLEVMSNARAVLAKVTRAPIRPPVKCER